MAHASRLRKGRHSEPGRIYLITVVTWKRLPHFTDFAAARLLVKTLQDVEPSASTLCYVVMPDHLHWLMQLAPGTDLSVTVRLVKALGTKRIKACRPTPGKLWQHGFHDHALRREEDVRALARYVIANPLRAGLARSVREYSHWDACWL